MGSLDQDSTHFGLGPQIVTLHVTFDTNRLKIYGVFGRVDFMEDGKKRRKNKEIKLFRKCLIGKGKEENDGGTWMFFPRTHQKIFSPK